MFCVWKLKIKLLKIVLKLKIKNLKLISMSTKKKKILIVEDDADMLMMLSEKFKSEGFDIIEAENGKIGLKKAFEEKPDLILLDIMMPVMNGIKMLKQLRREKQGKSIPVVVLTNLSDESSVAESLESGVSDYLIKMSWKLDGMVKKVKEKLGV
jgi:CheY-like chemotaxis protein